LALAVATVFFLLQREWLLAVIALIACAWFVVAGWNRLHGRWTYTKRGGIPERAMIRTCGWPSAW
jgi:hypothetical protein